MLVSYGRQAIYHAAGNPIECRYCEHSIGRPDLVDGRIWCIEFERQEPATAHCTYFVREPGTD